MSLVGTVLGLAIAWTAGGLLVWNLWPGRARPLLFVAALAWPAGLALTSSAYFLWMVLSGGRSAWVPALELAGLATAALWTWRRRRERRARLLLPPPPRPVDAAALAVLAAVALWSLVLALRLASASPWGYWDAWARIALKARFLAAGGPGWTWILHGDGVPHHAYPLLLECSVARLWWDPLESTCRHASLSIL